MAATKPDFSVGLTGGIGSGKTTVADLFGQRGAALIDTDQIAHQLTAPGGDAIAAIASTFGTQFLLPNGAMDRAKMRDHVFGNPSAKRDLESILHPLIGREVGQAALQANGLYTIFIVPLLVESGRWRTRVSRILVVDCPESLQIKRVMQRNSLSEAQVRAIMATQASRLQRNAEADDLIENGADTNALITQVDRLHGLYCSLAART